MVYGKAWKFRNGKFIWQRIFSIQHGQETNPEVVSPFGRMPNRIANQQYSQFGGPLGAFFGAEPTFGPGRRGQRRQSLWEAQRNSLMQGQGPLSQFAQQAAGFLPQVYGQAQGAGQQIASLAPGIFNMLKGQVNTALGQLPGIQQGAAGQVTQAQDALRSQQQMLREQQSPIASQALYQNALRQGLEGQRGGQAARGLLDAGSAQAGEETFGRDLAAQFAQQQFGNQMAAAQGVQGGLQGVQGALGAQAGLLPLGAQLAGMTGEALPGLQAALQAGYATPMDAISSVYRQLAAFQDPQLALLQLTQPQVASRGEGGGGWGILGTTGSGTVVYWKGYR